MALSFPEVGIKSGREGCSKSGNSGISDKCCRRSPLLHSRAAVSLEVVDLTIVEMLLRFPFFMLREIESGGLRYSFTP